MTTKYSIYHKSRILCPHCGNMMSVEDDTLAEPNEKGTFNYAFKCGVCGHTMTLDEDTMNNTSKITKTCKNEKRLLAGIRKNKKLKEKLMKKVDKTYTIAELNTMISFYDAQKTMLARHLAVAECNNVLTTFVSDNKLRIPTAARVDIASYASTLSAVINEQIANLNTTIDNLNAKKNALLMEIADIYGATMPDADNTLIDEYNKVYNDYLDTCNDKAVDASPAVASN